MKIDELIAGDTLDFTDSVPEYPASDGWTLKYRLIPRFATPTQTPIDITATTYEVSNYRIQAAASVTATWKAGAYTWTRWVEKAGPIRQSLGAGQLTVLQDPATAVQGYDSRSHARKMVDGLEAALEALNHGVRTYTINGRQWTKEEIPALLQLLNFYRAQVSNEMAADAIASGKPNPRVMKGSFRRVT